MEEYTKYSSNSTEKETIFLQKEKGLAEPTRLERRLMKRSYDVNKAFARTNDSNARVSKVSRVLEKFSLHAPVASLWRARVVLKTKRSDNLRATSSETRINTEKEEHVAGTYRAYGVSGSRDGRRSP